jgi:hypothetical protein
MKTAVFAWYDEMPIACEGDDMLYRVITLKVRSGNNRFQHAERILEKRMGGYVQLWSIQE